MIQPIEPCFDYQPFFVTLDIENDLDGNVLDIDTCWREETGVEHVTLSDWSKWCDFFIPLARDDIRFRQIYAHNGGGWDWLSLVEFLMKHPDRFQCVSAIVAGSNLVTLSVQIERRFTLQFSDSLQLLRSGLDKLGKKLVGSGKVESDVLPHVLKQQDSSRYYEYLRRDTELLLEVLEKAIALIRENVALINGFGPTIGSTAMRVFKTIGIDEPITVPKDDELRSFLRESYYGGRVQVFRYGHFERIKVYDVNSLYPYAMANADVPVSDRGHWVDDFEQDRTVSFYKAVAIQKRDDIPEVLCTGNPVHNTFRIRSREGVFSQCELNLLLEVDSDAEIHVEKGFVFQDTGKVFATYVDRLYNLRLSDPDGPVSLMSKFLLNSLYGKMGQRSEREKLVMVDSFQELAEMVQDDCTVRLINEDANIYSVSVDKLCNFEHVGIASVITSFARCCLYRGLLHAGDGLVYCDTDSVHTVNDLPSHFVGKNLGQYKTEFEGEGIYCGKKLYGLRSDDGSEKIRSKGVSVGGNNGCELGFDDLLGVSKGKIIECRFQRPATVREVMNGKPSCRFMTRNRKIKVT